MIVRQTITGAFFIMSISDEAAKQLPHAVSLPITGMDRHPATGAAKAWCEANTKGEFKFYPAGTTWRAGTPGWVLPIRFADDRDATLFKLFHEGAV